MESVRRVRQPHPREESSFLSVLFFTWTWRLFKRDSKKSFQLEDIWNPVSEHQSLLLGDRLEKIWDEEIEKTKKKGKLPNLMSSLFKTFIKEITSLGALHILHQVLDILMRPFFLRMMLGSFRMEEGGREYAVYAAVGLIVTSSVTTLLSNHYNLKSFVLGAYLRAACVSLVYRKSLRLRRTVLGETSPGHIVNLVSNDVSRFELLALLLHFMWSAPLVALVVGYFLYQEVGLAGVGGLLIVFTVAPLQSYTAKVTSKYRLQTALKTDERIRSTDEVISGVSVIKMYAWEKPFINLLELARKLELRIIKKTGLLRGLYMTFNIFTTRCALACTLIIYSLMGNPLKADKVFVVAAYFGIMSMAMSSMFVRGFAEIAECKVSIGRIQKFLLREEVPLRSIKKEEKKEKEAGLEVPTMQTNGLGKERRSSLIAEERYEETRKPSLEKLSASRIILEKLSASWDPSLAEPTLSNLTLSLRGGLLLGVIGPVGSGKTSFLQLILGEIPVVSGEMVIEGAISYAAQETWIFSGTVRQNILFGLPFERKRYKEVLKACALERDLELFPNSDQTVVGERGSSLSGGQKARINLARAVYRKADIYLLDDPLSAVDSHVCKHIFKHCLRGFLRGKSVILATHQLQFMRNMDQILVMDHGKMKQYGRPEDITEESCDVGQQSEAGGARKDSFVFHTQPTLTRMISINSVRSLSSGGDDISICSQEMEPTSEVLKETNTRYKGSVYWGFFRAGANPCTFLAILVLFALTQTLASSTDYWMAFWTSEEESIMANERPPCLGFDPKIVYASLIGSLFICALSRGLLFYIVCNQCSRGIHTSMVNNILSTNLNFFSENHSGGILNRFSKDLGGVDEALPKALLDCGQIFGQVAGAMVTSSVVNPWFLLPISIFTAIALSVRNFCIKTTKNMKRIESLARSPIYSHLNSSLQGLVTIRAQNAQEFLRNEFDMHQDLHTSSLYTYLALQQGYSFILDVFGLTYLSLIILSFVYFNSGVFGAEVGLAITQTITVTVMLQWAMRQSSELANLMTSMERLLAFTKLPQEETNKGDKVQASLDWPSGGELEFRQVYVWYNRTEVPVIQKLSVTISKGEKVGIVGRTGAGKSSLIGALFRLTHLEGLVLLDGVDTASVPLETLRSRMSIIPQNPVLFSGTIRRNLDPFNDYPDYVLWRALEEVELKEVLREGLGLLSRVSDGGSNLSVGQRQLVCLARAIVKNNKLIVLDEATASVDPTTDALIQRTIRNRFRRCTVLTVAHRLQTVIDCDRILVMDSGRMVEFDKPHVLLQAKGGYFYHLVQETGKAMASQLAETAEKIFLRKQQESLED